MKAGRELDVLVAEKVMGLIVSNKKNGSGVSYITPKEGECYAKGADTITDGMGWVHELCPLYSTDISAAWRVVEHFKSLGKELQIVSFSGSDEQQWSVSNCNCESMFYGGWEGTGAGEITVFSDTAPHAICLAALEAVGHE